MRGARITFCQMQLTDGGYWHVALRHDLLFGMTFTHHRDLRVALLDAIKTSGASDAPFNPWTALSAALDAAIEGRGA